MGACRVVHPVELVGDLGVDVVIDVVLQVLGDGEDGVDVVIEGLGRVVGDVSLYGGVNLVLRLLDPSENLVNGRLLSGFRRLPRLCVGGEGLGVPLQERIAVGVECLYVTEKGGAEVGLEVGEQVAEDVHVVGVHPLGIVGPEIHLGNGRIDELPGGGRGVGLVEGVHLGQDGVLNLLVLGTVDAVNSTVEGVPQVVQALQVGIRAEVVEVLDVLQGGGVLLLERGDGFEIVHRLSFDVIFQDLPEHDERGGTG